MVEHLLAKEGVEGSNPFFRSNFFTDLVHIRVDDLMDWPIFGAFIGTLLFVGIVLWLRPGLPHWSYYGRMPWRVLPEPPRRRR